MLKIYICEDEYYQQRYLEKIIKKTICIENYDMQISLMTNDPYEVLNNIWSYVNILDTKSQTFLCYTSS